MNPKTTVRRRMTRTALIATALAVSIAPHAFAVTIGAAGGGTPYSAGLGTLSPPVVTCRGTKPSCDHFGRHEGPHRKGHEFTADRETRGALQLSDPGPDKPHSGHSLRLVASILL